MRLREALDEPKMRAQFTRKRRRVVADDVEAAAARGAFGSESADEDVTARPQRADQLAHVRGAIPGRGQEVKDGAVVPQIESAGGQIGGQDVGSNPPHLGGGMA